ncbi:MAG: sulfatase-like hydrolase/transferase, partial [Draconibacterium sp.]|nr:sulfatase-like hydrolase/transferase [Draconibacterium sp.]
MLILVDDMGYGDPQCYVPESKIPTPNIDKLASEGIRFTDAHSPSSVCTPTRYAILTGRYAWRTYLKSSVLGPYSKPLLERDRLTIPKMLKEKGYSTALIGKWHLGMQWGTKKEEELPALWDRNFDISVIDHSKPITEGPLAAGFDYYFGVDVPNFPPYIYIENDKIQGNPSILKPDNMYGNKGMMLPGWKLEDILPTLTLKAVKFIDDQAKNSSGQPFFLQVTTTSPHTPIVPANEFIGKSQAG